MKTSVLRFWPAWLLVLLPFSARALDAGVSYAVYSTLSRAYLEVNLEISAASVFYQPVDSTQLQAKVEVLILVQRGDEVANYEKYVLTSPLVSRPQTLLDVKRLVLEPGAYTLEVIVTDLQKPDNADRFTAAVQVDIGQSIYLSQLQLLRGYRRDTTKSAFVKNGYFFEPLPFAFYDRGATTLSFYAEIYHADKSIGGDNYLVRYFIERELGNGQRSLVTSGHQRRKPAAIDALLVQMDISKLESGNYLLTVELRNPANELLAARQLPFQRSNPYLQVTEAEITDELLAQQFTEQLDEAALRYALRALSPLAAGSDAEMLKNILQGKELRPMRYYLFRHFVRADPNNPENAYRDYIALAQGVDKRFNSGFRYGFETDRGRTFIKYGKPDDLVHVEDDPSAPPYEIWVYYNFPKTNQNNVKFLFYNPTLAGEDYVLLHSNARGEINNPRWERDLYKRNAGEQYDGDNFHDATRMQRNVNRNARVYFEDF